MTRKKITEDEVEVRASILESRRMLFATGLEYNIELIKDMSMVCIDSSDNSNTRSVKLGRYALFGYSC